MAVLKAAARNVFVLICWHNAIYIIMSLHTALKGLEKLTPIQSLSTLSTPLGAPARSMFTAQGPKCCVLEGSPHYRGGTVVQFAQVLLPK